MNAAERHKVSTRTTWQTAGDGWNNWAPFVSEWLDFSTKHMLNMTGIGLGSKILDVAAGNGGQSICAAKHVGPHGSVLATDLTPEFLSLAVEHARQSGVANLSTQVMDGENLQFAEASFDAVLSRLGLMFFPNPLQGLHEMRRVLKDGGKKGCIVFGAEKDNPFFSIPVNIIRKRAGLPPLGLGQPGPFSLSSLEYLEDLFDQAGFQEIVVDVVSAPLHFSSVKECIRFEKDSLGGVHQQMDYLDAGHREEVWAEIEDELAAYEGADGFESPCTLFLCVGTKQTEKESAK